MSLFNKLFGSSRENRNKPSELHEGGICRVTLNSGQSMYIDELGAYEDLAAVFAPIVRDGGGQLPDPLQQYQAGIIREEGVATFHLSLVEGDLPELGKGKDVPLVMGVAAWQRAADEPAWRHVKDAYDSSRSEHPAIFHSRKFPAKPERLPWISLCATPGLYLYSEGDEDLEMVLHIAFALGVSIIKQ